MKTKTSYSVGITTALLLVYVVAVNVSLTFAVIFFLFLLTTASLWWMVYSVLTDKSNLSGKTFDEYFYEDTAERRSK